MHNKKLLTSKSKKIPIIWDGQSIMFLFSGQRVAQRCSENGTLCKC